MKNILLSLALCAVAGCTIQNQLPRMRYSPEPTPSARVGKRVAPGVQITAAAPDVFTISWPASSNDFYSLAFTPDLLAPYTEVWRGSLANPPGSPPPSLGMATGRTNVTLALYPPTSDAGSAWAIGASWPGITNGTVRVRVTDSGVMGFWRVGSNGAKPTVEIRR
jgi:hypothetical protein